MPFPVIPAKAGIQCLKELMTDLDPGFRRGDDFLQDCQSLIWRGQPPTPLPIG